MKSIYFSFAALILSTVLSAQNIKFTIFNQANTPAFTTNAFKQVAVGKHNTIWVGTANAGIYRFNGNTWVKGTTLLNNNIKAIVRGTDSSIVVGQAGYNAVNAITGGMNKYPDTSFTNQYWGTLTGGLPSRYVNSACVSNDGTIWAGNGQDLTAGITKEGGIAYLSPGAANFVKITDGLPASDIRIYTIASSITEIWASIDRACPTGGCIDAGILRYSLNGAYIGKFGPTNTPIPFITSGAIVRAICFSSNNKAWVGLNTTGLAVYSGGFWFLINSTNSKFPNGAAVNYNAMKADLTGRVYIGTSMGLLVFTGGPLTNPASYRLYTTANGLPSNNVTGIEIYDNKTVWLTTGAGVVKMEESFRPDPNGWGFSNSRANIWPPAWYNQFNYATDPYLGGAAVFPQLNTAGVLSIIPSSSFPDWSLFVRTIGEAQCYQTIAGVKVYKNLAVSKYFSIIDNWGGSCFGFVQSSFMAWDSIQRFRATFPTVGPWTTNKLFDIPLNDENRKCINTLMTKQSQQTYWDYVTPIYQSVTPRTTLTNVRQMLQDNSRNDRGLLLYNQNGTGGHIVNPYKIVRDTVDPDVRFIYIYDNNYPGDSTRRVTIDSILNCWFYNLSTNAGNPASEWGGFTANKGLVVCTPVREWYNPVNINNVAKKPIPSLLPGDGRIEILNRDLSDILITNGAGQTEGYEAGNLIQNIPDAVPMLNLTGSNEVPRGYYLPDAEYNVKLSNFKSTASSMSLYNNTAGFNYTRAGATLAQKDKIHVTTDGILVMNQDNLNKTVGLSCVFEDSGNEMNVEIRKLGQSTNGNSGLHKFSATEVKLLNTGAATKYDLSLRYVSSTGVSKFLHDSVTIAANTAHVIHPDWANLKIAYVMVFVDNGNNGSFEDTLYLGNDEAPQFLTFPTKLSKSALASMDTIHLINDGGGVLNWTATSSDTTWLKLNGIHTGIDTGSVVVSILADTAGARSGLISYTAAGALPYTIKVTQEGIINAPINISASDGTFTDGVHVIWNSAAGATHYKVYRAENAGSDGTAISNWISDTTYIDSTCIKGQFYYYMIKAAQDSLGLNTTDFSQADDGWVAGYTANFSFSGECSGQPTVFTETSTSHTQHNSSWDIGSDGTVEYTGNVIQHTFATAGTYTVKLTVTDNNSITETKIKTIVIKPFPLVTMVSDTLVCANQSIMLNAGSGFNAYLWSTGATTSSITVDSTGNGFGLAPVSVKVTGSNGCSTIATTAITWDSCSNLGSYNLSGIVTYDNNPSTVLNNVSVLLKQGGSVVQQTTTDVQGNYTLTNLQSGTYILTGGSDKAWGGVNSIDALKVMRHFVGLISLQGVRLLAADVNGTGNINSADALLVAKRFVGLVTSFAAGDWAFAKDTVQISNLPNQTANLKAVVYGDVDGSYVPLAKIGYGMELTNKGMLFSETTDELEIPVSVITELEVGAISIVLSIPSQVADITNVMVNDNGTLLYNVVGDELRIAWYSLSPMHLQSGDRLFSIKCHLKPNASLLTGSWTLDPNSQLADANGDVLNDVKITMPEVVLNANQYYLGQNIPNPFSTSSEITWYMPEAGRVVLKVYDILGNHVRTLVNSIVEPGSHTAILEVSDLQPGTYNYRIEISGTATGFSQTKQFVLIK